MLLCVLLTGLVGKSYASAYHHNAPKSIATDDTEHHAKVDIYQLSVEAIVPLLHLEITQYYCVLFAVPCVSQPVVMPTVQPLTRVQEQYFKTLFQDIISPNAP